MYLRVELKLINFFAMNASLVEFKKFLVGAGIYRRFLRNLREAPYPNLLSTCSGLSRLDGTDAMLYVCMAFYWINTFEGPWFWENVDQAWVDYVKGDIDLSESIRRVDCLRNGI